MDSEYLPLIIFFAIVPIVWAISSYNTFIKYGNLIEEAWSGIDVALKRRFNLIPNLAHTVRSYSDYEADSLQQITETRIDTKSVSERSTEESRVSQSLQGLLAVAEAYPELKASTNFEVLQQSLNEVEKEIVSARKRYNTAVRKLNTHVQSFPSNFIAKVFRFREAQYFSLELATERDMPNLNV